MFEEARDPHFGELPLFNDVRDPHFDKLPTSSQSEVLNEFFSIRVSEAELTGSNENPATEPQKNKWEFEIIDIDSPKIFDKQLNKNWFIQDSGLELINSKLYYLVLTRNVHHPDLKPMDLFLINVEKSGHIIDIRKARVDYDSYLTFVSDDLQRCDLFMSVIEELRQGDCDAYEIQELSNILETSKYNYHEIN